VRGEVGDEETKTTYQYVFALRKTLEETCKIAQDLMKAKVSQRKFYDRKTRKRFLKEGDQALILLPTSSNKLMMQWRGPYTVVTKMAENDSLSQCTA
jgi:hypothetical protein